MGDGTVSSAVTMVSGMVWCGRDRQGGRSPPGLPAGFGLCSAASCTLCWEKKQRKAQPGHPTLPRCGSCPPSRGAFVHPGCAHSSRGTEKNLLSCRERKALVPRPTPRCLSPTTDSRDGADLAGEKQYLFSAGEPLGGSAPRGLWAAQRLGSRGGGLCSGTRWLSLGSSALSFLISPQLFRNCCCGGAAASEQTRVSLQRVSGSGL